MIRAPSFSRLFYGPKPISFLTSILVFHLLSEVEPGCSPSGRIRTYMYIEVGDITQVVDGRSLLIQKHCLQPMGSESTSDEVKKK